MAQNLTLYTVVNSWPPEDILVGYAEHVSRIKHSSVGIDEVVGEQESVPLVDPLWDIISELSLQKR